MTSISSIDPLLQIAEERRIRLESLAQITAHDFELRLDLGDSDQLDEGYLVLGLNAEEVAGAQYLFLKGQTLHLLGHYLTSSLIWLGRASELQTDEMPHFLPLWHALEDARMENWMLRRWPGAQSAFDTKVPPNLGGNLLGRMPPTEQVELGVYMIGRGFLGAKYGEVVKEPLESATPIIQRGGQGDTPADSIQATLELYPYVGHLLRGVRVRRKRRMPERSQPEAEREKAAPRPDRAQKDAEEQPEDLPEIELDESQLYEIGVAGRRRELPEWYRPGSAPWFERGLGDKQIHPSVLCADRQTIVEPPSGDAEQYRLLRAEMLREVGYLSDRLLDMLREGAYLRYAGSHRTGKLNTAKLWKQRIGVYRLFQRRSDNEHRSLACSLLIDESASMKGSGKMDVAVKAAIMLAEVFSQLDVPLEIIGYTTSQYEARAAMLLGLTPPHEYRTMRCSNLEHRIYKRFDEPFLPARSRLTGLQPRHNNWDEEHLLFAYRRIQARSESRKVIIVISDGQPNGDANHLIDTVAAVERMGCTVIAAGIGGDFVTQVYGTSVVVSDLQQLAEGLLRIFRRLVGYGAQSSELLSQPGMAS